jgi:UPF0716 family protein affecting phage T7 exclusion
VTLTGTYGALLIRADGSYTYTPGTAAQALNTGDRPGRLLLSAQRWQPHRHRQPLHHRHRRQ